MRSLLAVLATIAGSACAHPAPPPSLLPAGVVLTYPRDGQRDVPLGAHLWISFAEPVDPEAVAGCTVAGPGGSVDIAVAIVGGGKTLEITSQALQPGTEYAVSIDPAAAAPLLHFTTRNDRPLAGAPTLIAFDGSDPAAPGTFRPIFETSTIQLVFSEPLDPRSVAVEPGGIELVDAAGAEIPATLIAHGIHAALDPIASLTAGAAYELRLGDHLVDLGGDPVQPIAIPFTPVDSLGAGAIAQTFRTRAQDDPDAAVLRTDTSNAIAVDHPLIGSVAAQLRPTVIVTELGDPTALGGPIAFTIPRGQRFASAGLDIALAGAIPSGLTTGDIQVELLGDAGGLIYRNTNQPPDTIPDNDRAPLLVDLGLDLAVYATDPVGNAVLAQTVLGAQLSGLAIADHGALAIEALGAIDIDLLGIASAPTNLVLDLISDPGAAAPADTQPPVLIGSLPAAGTAELGVDQGIELQFDEPIDLDRARAGGIVLRDGNTTVAAGIESHGAVTVLRPRAPLPDGHAYRVDLIDVADLAGNAMAPASFTLATPALVATTTPLAIEAVLPGAPCALVGGSATSAGRCAGGRATDQPYAPFALAANEPVEVIFDQPAAASSLVLGTTCNAGSVRIEQLDEQGQCTGAVAGTLLRRARHLAFVPDRPWLPDARYRLQLISGPDASCDAGEICGANGRAASFDPLAGTTASAGGGPDLVVDFVGAPASVDTSVLASAAPFADVNGSGLLDPGELATATNRVALRIATTAGLVTSASFPGPDCLPDTPQVEACMYIAGAIPARLGASRTSCALPDGTTAATCIPVTMTPQAMYSTSVAMTAAVLGIGLTTATGMTVMRMREPATGPLEGYIVQRDGRPTMIAALDLYMDAPDMTLPLAQHDLHSKPLSVLLDGPVTFRPDGRLSIALGNVADVPITIGITAPLGLTGGVSLIVPARTMTLQLLTPAQRGSLP